MFTISFQIFSVVLAMLAIPPKSLRKLSENICHIEFSNKVVELINPSTIFDNINVKSKLSETCNDFPIPTDLYYLTKLLHNKIFNFNTFIFSVNVDGILENLESLPCSCKDLCIKIMNIQ